MLGHHTCMNPTCWQVGWVITLNLPRHQFQTRAYLGLPPSALAYTCPHALTTVLRGVCTVFCSARYRGLLVTSLAAGSVMGLITSASWMGPTSVLAYYAEDYANAEGALVRQAVGSATAVSCFVAALFVRRHPQASNQHSRDLWRSALISWTPVDPKRSRPPLCRQSRWAF